MKIGVLGAGQLGRMLALAGVPLGLQFRFYDPAPDSPASEIAEQVVANYNDWDALTRFAEGLDVITYEFENIPVETVTFLEQFAPMFPPLDALRASQDRLTEKRTLLTLGIPTPLFDAVESWTELEETALRIGLPAVLKTRRFGYDGKGQAVLRTQEDLQGAWQTLGGSPLILEGFISFERELSLIGVRGRDGDTRFYPLVENHHREGILRLTVAPAPNVTAELQTQAERHLNALMQTLNYVGVLTLEFFEQNGRLIANEMAPRVHNSGHWTIEGAETSQFENHLRAIGGFPLGSIRPRNASLMYNCIGEMPERDTVLAVPGAHLHDYGKLPRPKRKVGHLTLCGFPEELERHRATVEELIT